MDTTTQIIESIINFRWQANVQVRPLRGLSHLPIPVLSSLMSKISMLKWVWLVKENL